jgi:hypothetical protein
MSTLTVEKEFSMGEIELLRFLFTVAWLVSMMMLFLNIGLRRMFGRNFQTPIIDGLFYSLVFSIIYFLALRLEELNGFIGPAGKIERLLSLYVVPVMAAFYVLSVLFFLVKAAQDLRCEDFDSLGDGPLPEDELDPAAFKRITVIEV